MTPFILVTAEYRPVLDPLPIHGAEWAVLPLIVFLLAMSYKAVRTERPERFWRETALFAAGVIAGLAAISAASWIFIELAYALAP